MSCISSHRRSFGEKCSQYSSQLAPPHFLQCATANCRCTLSFRLHSQHHCICLSISFLSWHIGLEDTSGSGERCSSLFPKLRRFHGISIEPSGCLYFPLSLNCKGGDTVYLLIQALLEIGLLFWTGFWAKRTAHWAQRTEVDINIYVTWANADLVDGCRKYELAGRNHHNTLCWPRVLVICYLK